MAKKKQLIYDALWEDPIPVHYLTDPIYRDRVLKMLEGKPGIYALYNANQLYYVGQTGDLYWRNLHHSKRDRHNGKWNKFKFFVIYDREYLNDLEALILNIYKPEGNDQIKRFDYGAYGLQDQIRKLVKDIRKAAKNSY